MRDQHTTFEFYGCDVQTEAQPVGRRWQWKYVMDASLATTGMGYYSFLEHAALEEAGIAARDRIRTMRNPAWRSNVEERTAATA